MQRRFTKRLHGLRELSYGERLSVLNLQSLELRRLHYDLNWCYKILFGLVCVNSDEFFELSDTNTRGHPYKLYKQHSYHSARLYFFTHTHTHTHLTAFFPGLPGWAGTRKVKPILILLEQETVSGSGISWAICNSAPRSRQITTPAPHHSSFFTGRMPFLPSNRQRQSTEGNRSTLVLLQWTYNQYLERFAWQYSWLQITEFLQKNLT